MFAIIQISVFLYHPSTDNSTSIVSTDDVMMTSSPSDVMAGLTDELDVICELPHNSHFSSVVSLILSKSSDGGKTFTSV